MTGARVLEQRRLPLRLTSDQRELQQVVRSFLGDLGASDPERAGWRRMAEQLGLQGLALPEDLGGSGYGLGELAVVFEELGRSLSRAPMLGTVALAARVLLHCPPSPARDDALRAIAGGAVVATASTDPARVSAGPAGLTGTTAALPDADVADVAVVAAGGADGPGLYLVRLSADGVDRDVAPSLDLTRGSARLRLTGARGDRVADADAFAAAVGRGIAEATVLLACEAVGGARAALEESVAYSKVRTQFGRQIGSFQSLKHRMADILIQVEGAWSTCRYAAALADVEGVPLRELALAAGVAKAAASEAQLFAASEEIQIHGGIGFTWEHQAHLRFRRAKATEVLLGLPRDHDARALPLLTEVEP